MTAVLQQRAGPKSLQMERQRELHARYHASLRQQGQKWQPMPAAAAAAEQGRLATAAKAVGGPTQQQEQVTAVVTQKQPETATETDKGTDKVEAERRPPPPPPTTGCAKCAKYLTADTTVCDSSGSSKDITVVWATAAERGKPEGRWYHWHIPTSTAHWPSVVQSRTSTSGASVEG